MEVIAPVPEAPVLPAMQRDIAHMQPSVEGLIQSLFQARLKELKDTAAASSGALTPRSPHSPSAGTVRGTVLSRLSGGTAATSSAAAAAGPSTSRSGGPSRPRVSLSRHSDMSAVTARQSSRAEEGSDGTGRGVGGRVHKSTSAGTLARSSS